MEVRERKDGLDLRNAVLLDHVPVVVAQEEQTALRMVDDVDDVVGVEVLQNGHDDRAVGDGRDVGDAPAGVVAADQRDFVASFDTRLFVEQVQLGDFLGHFVVGKGLFLEIIGQGGQLAVFAETGFVYLQEVFGQHGSFSYAKFGKGGRMRSGFGRGRGGGCAVVVRTSPHAAVYRSDPSFLSGVPDGGGVVCRGFHM